MLARCLASLPAAIARVEEPVFVVVVENSPDAQARATVEGFADQLDVIYAQEEEPGIPFARNRAVEMALARGCAWLIFIDDDEWVAQDWLEQMLAGRSAYPQADVLTGPVLRDYPETAPDWLPRSGHDGVATGTSLQAAATNNTAVASHVFSADGLGLRFEEKMRYTGGSDTEIFLRVTRQGGQVIWIAEAQVFEEYPDNRSTLGWHIARNIRRGSAGVMIERLHERPVLPYVVPRIGHCLYLTFGRLAQALVLFIPKRRRGRAQAMKAVLSAASAWGYLRGLFNLRSEPYRRPDGR
ncbi:glycosyl transferase [Roseobacter cerasinus]|uniref:Glycosyl transferase n=2 Tax=Roseobacter cerasinus TaxID=2602289 RepID=A0A640W1W9_9RHOB|nr:glycosyl transferase [Roseobacter cerasinus]